MKKFLLIILIFSILVSIFIPASNVDAQTPINPNITNSVEVRAAQQGDASSQREEIEGGCGLFDLSCWFTSFLRGVMVTSSWVLFLAGTIFNFVIDASLNLDSGITDSNGNATGVIGVVNFGWSLFRDIANIFFIFIILWIGISTILNLSGGSSKKLLIKVVIVALLINFSLFFTKVIIDVSNTVAVGFYNVVLQEAEDRSIDGAFETSTLDAGLSELFVDKLKLVTIVRTDEGENVRVTPNFQEESNLVYIGGTFFILTSAFVFFAGAVLFIIRTIVLIFLMILAPLAYIGSLLPATQSYANEWWDKLLGQAYFAPFYMMLIFVAIRGLDFLVIGTEIGYDGALTTVSPGASAVFFNFFIIIGLMVGALIISKRLGIAGAGLTINSTKNAAGRAAGATTGFIGRQTFGRAGERISRSENSRVGQFLKDKSTSDNRIVRGISGAGLRFADKTSQQSFDVRGLGSVPGKAQRGGFKKDFETKVKKEVDFTKSLGDSGEVTKGLRDENKNINDLKEKIKRYEDSGDSRNTEALERARADLEAAKNRLEGYKDKKGERQRKRAEIRKRPTIVSQIGETIPFVDVEAGPDRFGIETSEKIEKLIGKKKPEDSIREAMKKILEEEEVEKKKATEGEGGDEEKKDES